MVNKIEEFLNNKFGEVRAVKLEKVIWFVADDIAKVLQYRMASDMTRNIEDEDLHTQTLRTDVGDRNFTMVNEGGVYSAVLSITKRNKERYELARDFKRWITNEVLPTLRETGGYVEDNREEEFVNNYFEGLSDETKKMMIKELSESNKKLRVKADKYDQVLNIESSHTFTEVAKILSTRAKEIDYDFTISPSALTKHLRDHGILAKTKSKGDYTNTPIKKYEQYFDVVIRTVNEDKTKAQTRVKMNGVDFIYDMVKDNNFSLFM